MAKILTDAAVRKYAPASKRRRIQDGGARSLFLIIEPSCHKSWQMRFQHTVRADRQNHFGPVAHRYRNRRLAGHRRAPDIGGRAGDRRPKCIGVVHWARMSPPPQARKHRQRAELIDRGNNTFAAAVRDYIEDYAKAKQRRWRETARLLGLQHTTLAPIPGGLAQRWHEKPVGEIDGHDPNAVDEARRSGVPGLVARNAGTSEPRARALHAVLSMLFTWLQRQRRVPISPCTGLHRPAAPRARERTLSDDEVPLVLAGLRYGRRAVLDDLSIVAVNGCPAKRGRRHAAR